MPCSVGEFKQGVLRVYNAVNKRLFNVGVKQQNVDIVGNKIVILSVNARVPILKVLENEDVVSSGYLDALLVRVFKREIREAIEKEFGLRIVAVLKDYDAETEYAGTVIVFDRDIEQYLSVKQEIR